MRPTHSSGAFSPIFTCRVDVPLWRDQAPSMCLCTAGSRTAVPLFCTLSPPITPEGQTRQTGPWWLSDVEQWLYREFFFPFFSLILISRDFSFHLQKFDRWHIVLWHSEWEDLWYVDQTKKACWSELLTPHPCFKLFSLDHPSMKQRLFLGLDWRWTKQKPLKSDDSFRRAFNA